MKTIFKNGTYFRVSDEIAENEVRSGTATYAPKSAWKRHVRDANLLEQELLNVKSSTKAKKLKKSLKLKEKQQLK